MYMMNSKMPVYLGEYKYFHHVFFFLVIAGQTVNENVILVYQQIRFLLCSTFLPFISIKHM